MEKILRNILMLLCACCLWIGDALAVESLRPVSAPRSWLEYTFSAELDEDVYSGLLSLQGEYAFCTQFSVYLDGSYRLLSYSYEYAMDGYIHNYANLHVSGLDETYVGLKSLIYGPFGLDVNWRLPPRDGSRKNRFQRMNLEPYGMFSITKRLDVGASIRYNAFLEDRNYKPGDELGVKAGVVWRPFDVQGEPPLWTFAGTALFQTRLEESENRNMKKAYRKMDDIYQGLKMKFSAVRYFDFMKVPFGIGLNYEIHQGTLFGFETGHRIGITLRAN